MARKTSTYGRREASDSEEEEERGTTQAIVLENALSRRFTVNISEGRRVSKRVRYETEEDQLVQKIQSSINVNGEEVSIDLLASAVDNFIGVADDGHSNQSQNTTNSTDEEHDIAEGLIDEDLDDLLLSFGPQLRLEEKDEEDEDVDPSNVVEFCDDDVDNDKVSFCSILSCSASMTFHRTPGNDGSDFEIRFSMSWQDTMPCLQVQGVTDAGTTSTRSPHSDVSTVRFIRTFARVA